ncbi:MAG: NAD(P)/FAD-dependent oxidoreductase [Phycisphaerae bacterium]
MQSGEPHRVVIVGGGFAGLRAALELRGADARVTLVDQRNFHLFQPLLYQVATGGLSPANIAAPLRHILRKQKNTRVVLGEAIDIDPQARLLVLRDGLVIPYDTLILATGVRHNYFGNDRWESLAPGLKTIEDATEIRRRILLAFERAEQERDRAAATPWLTFVIVGGGPTGVELAGTLAEIARDTLRHEFRRIDPAGARIILVEGADRVLLSYPPELSEHARQTLTRLGVTVRTGALVTDVREGAVTVRSGDATETIASQTVLWAAGVRASPLGRVLAERLAAPLDRAGRVIVQPDLTIPRHPEIFVLGDLAVYAHQGSQPLPGTCPVAMQQGSYVGRLILDRLEHRVAPTTAFHYRHKGDMATIGRAAAVCDFGRVRFTGLIAWLMWLFVHILFLIEFRNRLLVMVQWAWNYFTFDRAARLITGNDAPRSGD